MESLCITYTVHNTDTTSCTNTINTGIGPMHEEQILGNTPNNTHYLVLVLFFKVGIHTLKTPASAVLTVFETRGIPTFSNENENEAIGILRALPKIFSSCIRPIDWGKSWEGFDNKNSHFERNSFFLWFFPGKVPMPISNYALYWAYI